MFGCLRLDGKKMPLKFYYPTWRNGERVSGTLDGNGNGSGIYICFQEEKTLTYYFLSLDITVSHSSEMLTMGP